MSGERLIYLPLGGAGEIGMNCYVFGYGRPGEERLLVVDLGVTFGEMETTPGVDLVLPDVAWLIERRDRIDGILITHAHEDHIGALGLLWDQLRAPVYLRRFTGAIARLKMEERGSGISPSELRIVEPWPAQTDIGPFRVGIVPISHSVPESAGLVIDTPAGRVVHSGDFKIDRTPVVGEPFDEAVWRAIGDSGVLALTCDSTNVFSSHEGRSEASLGPAMADFMRAAEGTVVVTTFASNVARLKTVATAAREAGRSVVLLGRAMRRMVEVATETGYLRDFPPVVAPEEAASMPRERICILATGSQGERRAATAQLSQGSYLGLSIGAGDTFLLSSRTIPGNERSVARVLNALSEKGVELHDDEGGKYHVSGHANAPDLAAFHALIRPQHLIPMHGEHRHLTAHKALAEAAGRRAHVVTNGDLFEITGNSPRVVDQVPVGRIYLDGSVLVGGQDGVVRDRIRLAQNGHMTVTLLLDEEDDPMGDPWVETMGLPATGASGEPLTEVVEAQLAGFLNGSERKLLRDEEKLERELIRVARQAANAEIGKKPEVTVVVSRLQ